MVRRIDPRQTIESAAIWPNSGDSILMIEKSTENQVRFCLINGKSAKICCFVARCPQGVLFFPAQVA